MVLADRQKATVHPVINEHVQVALAF